MHRKRTAFVLLFVLALAATACGGPSSSGSVLGSGAATIPVEAPQGDLAGLVPGNTDVLIYVPSVETLVEKLENVVTLFGEEAAASLDTDSMIGELAGPLREQLDQTKPLAVAVAVPKGEDLKPVPTLILPVTDMKAALAVFEDAGQEAPKTAGSYVALAMGPPGKSGRDAGGVPDIAREVPTGDVVLRIDLARLIENHGDAIHEQLDGAFGEIPPSAEMGLPNSADMLEGLKGSLDDLLASAKRLDVSVAIDGTEVHLRGLFTAKDGSKLADASAATGDLAAMAGALPGDFPAVALVSFDLQKILEWAEPLMDTAIESMPEEERALFESMWKDAAGLYEYIGDRSALAYRLDETGMSGVFVMELRDAEKYFEAWNAMLDGDAMNAMARMGIAFERLPATKLAGHDVEHMALTMDTEKMMAWNPAMRDAPPEAIEASQEAMAKLFGADGWQMHFTQVGDKLVTVLGDEALLEPAIQGLAGGASGPLAAAIQRVGGKPNFLLRLEGRALTRGVLGLVRGMMPDEQAGEIPEVPDGKPVELIVYTSVDGAHYAGGLTLDLGAVAGLVEAFTGEDE